MRMQAHGHGGQIRAVQGVKAERTGAFVQDQQRRLLSGSEAEEGEENHRSAHHGLIIFPGPDRGQSKRTGAEPGAYVEVRMAPLIELEGLEVRYGRRVALRGLHGAFSGRAIGLLGPNGAGKSTLIPALLGLVAPSAGRARLLGLDIRTEGRRLRSIIGYMPENEAFIAGMNAVRFVRLMGELAGLPPEAALERAHEALFFVGLGEARYRALGTYSAGMRQMVKLAQAIAHGPRLLLLDEPTNGLDPPARNRMIQLIRQIRDSGQASLLISSHLLGDIEETCDQAVILKAGGIAAHRDLEQERRTNRRWVELEIRGDCAAFQEEVRRQGWEAAWSSNGRGRLILPDGAGFRTLYEIAARHEVQLVRLRYQRDSLEEIFLKAMEAPGGDS